MAILNLSSFILSRVLGAPAGNCVTGSWILNNNGPSLAQAYIRIVSKGSFCKWTNVSTLYYLPIYCLLPIFFVQHVEAFCA